MSTTVPNSDIILDMRKRHVILFNVIEKHIQQNLIEDVTRLHPWQSHGNPMPVTYHISEEKISASILRYVKIIARMIEQHIQIFHIAL